MTDVLFICFGNAARSQIAEAYLRDLNENKKTNKKASSAGVSQDTPKMYPKLPDEIVQLMKDDRVGIRDHYVKFVTRGMVEKADEIYVMCGREYCPHYLRESGKVTFWDVEDPLGRDLESRIRIRNQIKEMVLSIID